MTRQRLGKTDTPFNPSCAGLNTQRMCALWYTRPGQHVRLDLAAELAEVCDLPEWWANEALRWAARTGLIGYGYQVVEREGQRRRIAVVTIRPEKLESLLPDFDWREVLEAFDDDK